MGRKREPLDDLVIAPFTIIVDTREQRPWSFQGFKTSNDRELLVMCERDTLSTGDYTIKFFKDDITIERKSLDDAYNTFGANRDRWERELQRLARFRCALVIVEASWDSIMAVEREPSAKGHSFSPNAFRGSITAWRLDYPNVQWEFAPSVRFAEFQAFDYLQKAWKRRDELFP